MPTFVVNRNEQANGDHEVHNTTTGCTFMPAPSNQINLGTHSNCQSAVAAAKQQLPYKRVNGCKYCSTACHTS